MGPGSWIPDEGTQVVDPESRVPRIGPGPRVPGPGSHFSGMLFSIQNIAKILRAPSLQNIFEQLLLKMCS